MTELYFFLISLLASVVGAICGIGGGVLIKPLLEAFGVMDVKAISFLSGCTVFTMSLYSFFVSRVKKESLVDLRTGTPLSIGAACGGILGKDNLPFSLQHSAVDGFSEPSALPGLHMDPFTHNAGNGTSRL